MKRAGMVERERVVPFLQRSEPWVFNPARTNSGWLEDVPFGKTQQFHESDMPHDGVSAAPDLNSTRANTHSILASASVQLRYLTIQVSVGGILNARAQRFPDRM